MKKKLFFIFLLYFLSQPSPLNPQPYCDVAFAGEKIVAAYYSDRYHVASCKIAQKIHPDDLVTYKAPEEAVAAGLVPCKKCNPPVPADYKKTVQSFGSKKKADSDAEAS